MPPSTSKESGDTNHYIVHCIDDHAKSYKPGATYPVGDKCNNICTCKHRGQFDCTRLIFISISNFTYILTLK